MLLVQVPYGIEALDDDEPERALLVGVGEANRGRRQGSTYSLDDSLEELGGLAEAAGLKVESTSPLIPNNKPHKSSHVLGFCWSNLIVKRFAGCWEHDPTHRSGCTALPWAW